MTVSSRTRSAIGASAASLALTFVVSSTTVFGAIASSRVTASSLDVSVSRPTSRRPSARIASTWSGRATTVTGWWLDSFTAYTLPMAPAPMTTIGSACGTEVKEEFLVARRAGDR